MGASRVTRDRGGGNPSIRVEANGAFVVVAAAATIIVLLLAVAAIYRIDEPLGYLALFLFVVLGLARFLYLVGPARLISRARISADEGGIAARNARGITRYSWDRVLSVKWFYAGFPPFGQYTVVEVTPSLGDPESPYGPIDPYDVTLWFLSGKKRTLDIGRAFLSVCRRYGAKTSLVVGRVREP